MSWTLVVALGSIGDDAASSGSRLPRPGPQRRSNSPECASSLSASSPWPYGRSTAVHLYRAAAAVIRTGRSTRRRPAADASAVVSPALRNSVLACSGAFAAGHDTPGPSTSGLPRGKPETAGDPQQGTDNDQPQTCRRKRPPAAGGRQCPRH